MRPRPPNRYGSCAGDLVDRPKARVDRIVGAAEAGPRARDLVDHPKARTDRTVHAAGARPFVRVLTRKEHLLAEWPLDLAEHSLSLIADRGTSDAASERIVRPAHHRASESRHRAPGDLGQRRVDLTEHVVLSEPARLRLGTEDGRHDRCIPGLVDGEIEHPARYTVAEERCSDRVAHSVAIPVLRCDGGSGPVT